MSERPIPTERSARALTLMGYLSGFIGTAAGTAAFTGGSIVIAVAVWVLTFGMGALLVTGASVLRTVDRTERAVAALATESGRRGPDDLRD